VHLKEGQEGSLHRREIEQALTAAETSIAAINVEVERETRLVGLGHTPEALTPLEWVERYLAAKHKPPERLKRLLEAAEGLLDGGSG
jgi:hypothetical protein